MRNKLSIAAKLVVIFLIIGFYQVGFATPHKHKPKSKVVASSKLSTPKTKAKAKTIPAAKIASVAATASTASATPTTATPSTVSTAPTSANTSIAATIPSATAVAPKTAITSTTAIPMAAPIAAGAIPSAPDFDVKSYILIDANSGYIMAEKNANQRVLPASLTKLMTLYLTASALRSGQIHLNDSVVVSENAWRTGGSRMFIKVGSQVMVQDLINGIATASGNDAAVAIAEHLAGSEQAFVRLMNQTAHDLKMDSTNYADSNGSHADNYSTAADLSILARTLVTNFPEYYPWYKEKWITYNGIKQPNRNRLLWRDPSVDGIKTGHTDGSGYCLISSAVRNGMRLIAVLMGAKDDASRTNYSLALLNYGYRFFETNRLFAANTKVTSPKTLLGKEKYSDLGLQEDLYITLPLGQHKDLKAKAIIRDRLKAPIVKGQQCGSLDILSNEKVIVTKPLVALKDNPRANFIFAMFDYIVMLFNR